MAMKIPDSRMTSLSPLPSASGKSREGFISDRLGAWLILVLSALLWWFSLNSFNLRSMKDWGLLSIFPVSMIAAYMLLLAGFASLFARRPPRDTIFVLYTLLFILMLHGTPQLLYGTLRYSWAWKHVGIVDYIIRHSAIDPNIPILPVYHNWPGFFALNALFTQLAGFSGAGQFAGWAPVFFETFFAFGLMVLFRLFTPDRLLQWLGVWLFLLTNWVGQDYFSPQATAYLLVLGFLILILHWFGASPHPNLSAWSNRLKSILALFRIHPVSKISAVELKSPTMPYQEKPAKGSVLINGAVILLVGGVIVSVHQLTPFMAVAFSFVLVLFGIIRWRTLPIWLVLFISLWLLFPAQAYNREVVGSTMESFGKVDQTVNSGLVDVARISAGQVVVSWAGRGLSAFIVLLAGFGVFRRLRSGYLDLPAILMASAPIIVLFLNSYGGESLFRVYFFIVPFLSFLGAGAVLPGGDASAGWQKAALIGGLSLIMLAAFLLAYYGKERQYSFTPAEVEAAEYLYSHAQPGSLLVEGSRNYPAMFLNYEYFTYVPIDREPSPLDLLADPVNVLNRWLTDTSRYRESYLIITRSQKIYTDDIGELPRGSLDRIQESLEHSDLFQIVFANEDAIIFKSREGGSE